MVNKLKLYPSQQDVQIFQGQFPTILTKLAETELGFDISRPHYKLFLKNVLEAFFYLVGEQVKLHPSQQDVQIFQGGRIRFG